jgi:methyl-accepting chemotaxis protein
MSTKAKLILSFSAVVIINICFGVYSLNSLRVINDRVLESNSWTDGISELGDMQYCVASLRRYDLNYVQQRDAREKEKIVQRMEDIIRSAEHGMSTYREDVMIIQYDTEEQRKEDLAIIERVMSDWKVYIDVSQKLLEEADSGNYLSVVSLINGESMVLFDKLEESVAALVTFNKSGSKTVMKLSDNLYQSMRRTIAVILLFTTLFSVTIPILIVRGIRRSMDELLRVSDAVGKRDLTVSAKIFANDEFGKLAAAYNHIIANIRTLVSHIKETAAFMAQSAEDFRESAIQSSVGTNTITQRIEQVSVQSGKQRAGIESIMTSINDMAGGIGNITEKFDVMARGSEESVRISKEGGESMQRAISQMNIIESAVNTSSEVVSALGERSNEIGLIVGTITDISSQTNLLALNAAIEAARAGEQGRGFAVVAEEVKKLAGESQAAAEEISNLISSIQEETSHAVEAMITGKEEARKGALAMDDGGRAFDELAKKAVQSSEELKNSVTMMHEMSSEISDIASAVQNVENSGREIEADSQSIVVATEEQSASVSEVSSSSQKLAEIAADMLDLIKDFTV